MHIERQDEWMEQTTKLKNFLYSLSPIAVFFIVFGGMEWAVAALDIPTWLIASPSDTFKTLFSRSGEIWPHLLVTLQEIGIGYLLGVAAGITLALIFTSKPVPR
jgi:ABC-type nitrate/sulfonate/bicarbonate transport system permease component